jgi:sensor histidine kinase YesM
VGTNKGINKIAFNNGSYFITKYSTSDGLPSDVINALYVKDGRLWIGSPAGLSFFNESNIANSSICNLKILSVSVSGKSTSPDSTQHFSYRDNNFRFEYAGISFRSGNEITYWYKLNGLDKEWKQTQENSLDYEALPSGNYKLELYAVNKYGVKSKSFVYSFVLTTPFWKTIWFYLLVFTLVFSLILFFITRRNKRMRAKLEQANRFQKQLAELEQLALQSQMNPHFIFNCLNSIQQYILTNEKEKANLYLSKFSSLIRQTLDISAQKTITVAEEISYLRRYLDMELMRFGNNFEYTIKTENIIDPNSLEIPALLLQPFVENAIRHGIRFKDDGKGEILITFSLKENALHCQIKDNGVGREKALEFRSKQHIEYQSKGMGLTSKRINLLNTVNEKKIFVTVLDLKNKDNIAAGTSIEITMPV